METVTDRINGREHGRPQTRRHVGRTEHSGTSKINTRVANDYDHGRLDDFDTLVDLDIVVGRP